MYFRVMVRILMDNFIVKKSKKFLGGIYYA